MTDPASALAQDLNALLPPELCAALMASCSDPAAHPLLPATAQGLLHAFLRAAQRLEHATAHMAYGNSRRQLQALQLAMQAAHRSVAQMAEEHGRQG